MVHITIWKQEVKDKKATSSIKNEPYLNLQ